MNDKYLENSIYTLANLRDEIENTSMQDMPAMKKEIEVTLSLVISHLQEIKKDSSQPTKVKELPRPLAK